ncbi:MAG: hypothetical protein Q9210_007217 [Variospora velana]
MAEEIHGANTVIPWCMVWTTLFNGTLRLAMLIVVLFVTVHVETKLASPTGSLSFPFMQIFYDATGSLSGATAVICIIIIMDICAAIAFLATASRIVFALGRDSPLPFWRTMSTMFQPDSAILLYAIIVMAAVSCTIGLINIGSSTAFNAIISVGVSSLYASYVVVEAMLFYHRLAGTIRHANQIAGTTWHPNEFVWGPFHVPGVWCILLNAVGSASKVSY